MARPGRVAAPQVMRAAGRVLLLKLLHKDELMVSAASVMWNARGPVRCCQPSLVAAALPLYAARCHRPPPRTSVGDVEVIQRSLQQASIVCESPAQGCSSRWQVVGEFGGVTACAAADGLEQLDCCLAPHRYAICGNIGLYVCSQWLAVSCVTVSSSTIWLHNTIHASSHHILPIEGGPRRLRAIQDSCKTCVPTSSRPLPEPTPGDARSSHDEHGCQHIAAAVAACMGAAAAAVRRRRRRWRR